MAEIYLGLGTNTGNRKDNLNRCLIELKDSHRIEILKLSSVYESEPIGFTDQPNFLNMVVEIDTPLPLIQLLKLTQQIEKKSGRKKTIRWGPREIDIDIISYKKELISKHDLIVPHNQMHLRKFVLIPLKQISTNYIHPQSQKTINQLLEECSDYSQVSLVGNLKNLISK